MNLSPLYARIAAVEGQPGRNPIPSQNTMALWIYATIDGVGMPENWPNFASTTMLTVACGGVSVNYHTLADFRTQHVELLNQLLTESVASLLSAGLITLNRVAQDGMRVRASAGSSSFRRRATLEECYAAAQAQRAALQAEGEESDPAASNRRQEAARQRAVREKAERLQQALAEMAKLEAQKESRDKGSKEKARTWATDAEARKMKMADGGFRPAYNVQLKRRSGRGGRPLCPATRGHAGDRRMASADGYGGSQGDLQAACRHGGVRQCDCPQPQPVVHSRAGPGESPSDRAVVRLGAQPAAGAGTAPRSRNQACRRQVRRGGRGTGRFHNRSGP